MRKSVAWYVFVGFFIVMSVSTTWFGCSNPAPVNQAQSAPVAQTPPPPAASAPPATVPTPAPSETPPAAPAPAPAPVPAPVAAPVPSKPVTLYRDTWGVPHIYGETLADTAYAMGYAQAEDRLDDLYINVRTAVGSLAEVLGPDRLETDYIMHLVGNAELCEKYWTTAPEYVKKTCDSFVRGVQAYLAEHPDKKSDFALELQGWQCLAVGRAMILQWPLGTIQDDLKGKQDRPPFASNEWAVSPSRAADKCPILLTDPHLTWEGMAVFYEARIHAGDVEASGFFLVGTPLPVLGHSKNIGWACTTGGPDTSDVYAMKLNPENPMQYEYDGQWVDAEIKSFTINVKGQAPVEKPAFFTKLGPVVAEPDLEKGVAYVGACPYLDQAGLMEQMYKMLLAKDCNEFYTALGMNQFMEQNVMFADTSGNVQYVRAGRVPKRPTGYYWRAPVAGNTSKTQWQGIHDINDLVQVKNPVQGYMQNCNISPQFMMKDSFMTYDMYGEDVYNVTWDTMNRRAARALQLLEADDSVTMEEAMSYVLHTYDIVSPKWQEALKRTAEGCCKDRLAAAPELNQAVQDILAWNCEFVKESTAAPVVKFWRTKCQDAIDVAAIWNGKPLSEDDQKKMMDLLAQTLDEMKAKYGKTGVTWGETHFIGRGDKLFPCDGADFGGGPDKANQTETLLDVSSDEDPAGSGKYVARGGSGSLMLMFMRPDGIESYSLVCWGQNSDPQSPHFADQSEKLYSPRKLKSTWFKKDDLLKNLESEKVLTAS